jgi:hypothetical protein
MSGKGESKLELLKGMEVKLLPLKAGAFPEDNQANLKMNLSYKFVS